jgi:hypothetical protein
MQVDRRLMRSEIKKKLLIDQQRLRASDESENEELDNKKLMSSSVTRAAGLDVESSGTDSDGETRPSKFVNPLAKVRKTIDAAGEISEGEWSDDDASDKDGKKTKKEKK